MVGAVVRLVASPGSQRSGPAVLTDGDGGYRLTAPSSGDYFLLVERIGFARAEIGPVFVPSSGGITQDLSVATASVELAGLVAEVRGRGCDIKDSSNGGAQRLWDEARKALTATDLTEREAALRFRLVTRERTLSPRSLAIVDEERTVRTAFGGNSARSLPAEDLAEHGYVREGDDGSLEYYAPDARALLSDAFIAGHCLYVAVASGAQVNETGLVALAFEPLPTRDASDIEGLIWLEAQTGRLRRLEFSYVGLPLGVKSDQAGGVIDFLELADGRWIISKWSLRMPIVQEVRASSPFRGTVGRRMVTAILEQGSDVQQVRGPGVYWSLSEPTASLRGEVYDNLAGGPLQGALVRVAGRGWRTTTDSAGRFELNELPPGLYALDFDHPSLDSLGVDLGGTEVQLEAGETTGVTLTVPSRAGLAELACGGSGGAVFGRVVDGQGTPVPGAKVEGAVVGGALGPDGSATRTGRDGWYRICSDPREGSYEVIASVGPLRSRVGRADLGGEGASRVDLFLGPSGRSLSEVAISPISIVSGTAVEMKSRRPLAGVLVSLVDADGNAVAGALTDQAGRFALQVGHGTVRVRAEHLGYAVLEGPPFEVDSESRWLELQLAPRALEIDGLVVEVEARDLHLESVGFYRRRQRLGGGAFLGPPEIKRSPSAETSDLLVRLPGVERVNTAARDGNTTASRVRLRGATRASGGRTNCFPAVYIDGGLVRPGMVLTPEGDSSYPHLDDLVPPHVIRAIEVYSTPATTPVEFSSMGSLCGVIVIWTLGGG